MKDHAIGAAGVADEGGASGSPAAAVTHGLDDLERAVLDFETRRWRYAGAKESAIREDLDLSAVRYYQVLHRLLDEPAAMEYAPGLVHRLRQSRSERLGRRRGSGISQGTKKR